MNSQPLLEVTRGGLVESIHYGSIAVVDVHGTLLASLGDPYQIAFLRSSAKPFQAIPFVERGGVEHFHFTARELAIACASHEGSDEHVQTVRGMLDKIGIDENHLQCGAHLPGDPHAFKALILQNQPPAPIRNNCSGKHAAMLAHAQMRGLPLETYLDPNHPIQQDILASLSDLCRIPSENIHLGIDGCSAPNFAMPLYNAALGMARLCDPHDLPPQRAAACRKITSAMTSHPEMVSAAGEFDCELMRAGRGHIVCKRGAEGYQIIGLMPGVLGKDSPAVGIAFKVQDGDPERMNVHYEWSVRVRPAVTLEILNQLGALSETQKQALGRFGPVKPIPNHRGIQTGTARPSFSL